METATSKADEYIDNVVSDIGYEKEEEIKSSFIAKYIEYRYESESEDISNDDILDEVLSDNLDEDYIRERISEEINNDCYFPEDDILYNYGIQQAWDDYGCECGDFNAACLAAMIVEEEVYSRTSVEYIIDAIKESFPIDELVNEAEKIYRFVVEIKRNVWFECDVHGKELTEELVVSEIMSELTKKYDIVEDVMESIQKQIDEKHRVNNNE